MLVQNSYNQFIQLVSRTLMITIFSCFVQCNHVIDDKTIKKKSFQYRKDEDYLLYVCKKLMNMGWYNFTNYEKMYFIKNEEVEHSVISLYYNKDSSKYVALISTKCYNAYSRTFRSSRICPSSSDTVYGVRSLIGFRNSDSRLLKVYDFGVSSYVCYSKFSESVEDARNFYENELADKAMWKIGQGGKDYGQFISSKFKYNVLDKEFWEKCWLWEKDTVGSNGLYWFQIKSYDYVRNRPCVRCAEEFIVPNFESEYNTLQHIN